ncbi:MAG: RHS repeat-associated core domain-containing protein [Verrucomicrobiales bacterium]
MPDPVVATSGKLYIPTTDVVIPGPGRQNGVNLRFHRSYNNRENFTEGVLGVGWVTNLDIRLMETGTTRTIRDFDGSLIKLAPGIFDVQSVGGDNQAGIISTPPPVQESASGWTHGPLTLRSITLENQNPGYEFTKTFGTRYIFNSAGLLLHIKDRNANRITYFRDGSNRVIEMASGDQSLHFTYDANGKLFEVIDTQLNRTWTYTVTGNKLMQVRDPLLRLSTYSYSADSNLSQFSDRCGKLTQYTYTASDKVSRATYADGSYHEFGYNDLLGTSWFTDGDRKEWKYTYIDPGVVTIAESPLHKIREYTYDWATKRMTSSKEWLDRTLDPNNVRLTNYGFTATGIINNKEAAGGYYIEHGRGGGGGGPYSYYGPSATTSINGSGPGFTMTRVLDRNANVMQVTDRTGIVSVSTVRQSDGALLTSKQPLTPPTTYVRDFPGNVLKVTDPSGKSTRYQYDAANRRTKMVDDLLHAKVYTYDAGDRVTDVDYVTVGEAPDPLNPVFPVLATHRHTHYDYDDEDRVLSITDHTGRKVHYVYDFVGRVVNVRTNEDPRTYYTYNGRGLLVTTTDPAGRITTNEYDDDGRLTTILQPPPVGTAPLTRTDFTYWDNRVLRTLKDAKGRETTFTPHYGNRTFTTLYPDGTTEVSTDSIAGDMVSFKNRVLPIPEERIYVYDAMHRKLSQDCPSCGATFRYDGNGRLDRVDDAVAGVFAYAYDPAGRLLLSIQPDGTPGPIPDPIPALYGKRVSYEYDEVGRRKKLIYPDTTFITYDYTDIGQLDHIFDATRTWNFDYDLAGRREKLTFPNNFYTNWIYDLRGRLTDVVTRDTGNYIVTSDHINYDDASRITSDEITNGYAHGVWKSGGRNYGYDNLDRLTSANISTYGNGLFGGFGAQPNITYNYDEVGNRTSVGSGSTTTTYNIAALPVWNEYASTTTPPNSAVSFTYDARRCLTSDGVRAMTYDADDRLVQGIKDTVTVDFTYDWQNHITVKKVGGAVNRRYVYDGWHVIAEYDGAGALVNKYVHGPATDEVLSQQTSSSIFYFTRDHLGSTMALINPAASSNQAVVRRYTYDAFGNVTVRSYTGGPTPGAALLTNYLYTGREWVPELGLYNYRNRFYHAEIGRFLQPDPIGFEGGDVNLYAYCGNNPVMLNDPFGLWAGIDDCITGPIDEILVLGALAVAAALGSEWAADALNNLGGKVKDLFCTDDPKLDSKARGKGERGKERKNPNPDKIKLRDHQTGKKLPPKAPPKPKAPEPEVIPKGKCNPQ